MATAGLFQRCNLPVARGAISVRVVKTSLLAILLIAAPASAQNPPTPKGGPNAGLGYQPYCAMPGTQAVFVSPMGEPFRAAPGQPYPAAAWFVAADRNQDGVVDRVEFIRDADRFFKMLDIDHDGRLSPEEIDRYERDVAPEIALYGRRGGDFTPPARRPRGGESGYGDPMGAGRYAWLNIPEPVASADLDVNRIIDESEFRAVAGRRFETLSNDGKLTLALVPKTPQQLSLDGHCIKRPKPKKRRGDRDDDEHDGPPDRDGTESDRPEHRR